MIRCTPQVAGIFKELSAGNLNDGFEALVLKDRTLPPVEKPLPPEMEAVMVEEAKAVNRGLVKEEVKKPVDYRRKIPKSEFSAAAPVVIPSRNPRLEPIVQGLAGHPDIKAALARVKPPVEPDLSVVQDWVDF